MATYNVRISQTSYYDIAVTADGVADARRKARDWAVKADVRKLGSVFSETGPFEATTAHKVKLPIAARPANK